jgi:prophage maintenance system killer protein
MSGEGPQSSTDVLAAVKNGKIATIKNELAFLRDAGYLTSVAGHTGGYCLTTMGRLLTPLDAEEHCGQHIATRYTRVRYDENLLREFPKRLFTRGELSRLSTGTDQPLVLDMQDTASRKELERFTIEFAWRSSSIEGNTYDLTDTEDLIRYGKTAKGHREEEATMILNHKAALRFAMENLAAFRDRPDVGAIREMHKILTGELGVGSGFRKKMVGISGTQYVPLDNVFQIEEAVRNLLQAIERAEDPYTKALAALTGFSYIQAFEDGNKRTSRMVSNAILLAHGQNPASYLAVENDTYKKCILTFYETGSLDAARNMFLSQCAYSKEHYQLHTHQVEADPTEM